MVVATVSIMILALIMILQELFSKGSRTSQKTVERANEGAESL